MEKLKSFDEATAEAKQEMTNTLYQVAKMKAEFNLLKQAIINNLELDYSGKELTLRNDKLIVEIMYLIESDQMENLYSFKKDEEEKRDLLAQKRMENIGGEAHG